MAEEGGFLKAFGALEPVLYLPFESDGEFPQGTVSRGKLYRQDGRVGQGMGFADGALEMDCAGLGKGYSLLFWIRADQSLAQRTAIAVAAGTSCSQADTEPGFRVEIGERFVRAMVCGQLREQPCRLDMTSPGCMTGKWNHVAFTVDPEAGHLCMWINFGRAYYWGFPKDMAMLEAGKLYIGQDALDRENRLPAVMDDLCLWLNFGRRYHSGFPKDMAMFSDGKLFIGQDILGREGKRLPAVLDDLCVCRKSLTPEDVARLKDYYQVQSLENG